RPARNPTPIAARPIRILGTGGVSMTYPFIAGWSAWLKRTHGLPAVSEETESLGRASHGAGSSYLGARADYGQRVAVRPRVRPSTGRLGSRPPTGPAQVGFVRRSDLTGRSSGAQYWAQWLLR